MTRSISINNRTIRAEAVYTSLEAAVSAARCPFTDWGCYVSVALLEPGTAWVVSRSNAARLERAGYQVIY